MELAKPLTIVKQFLVTYCKYFVLPLIGRQLLEASGPLVSVSAILNRSFLANLLAKKNVFLYQTNQNFSH